jgi:hypothetical protein
MKYTVFILAMFLASCGFEPYTKRRAVVDPPPIIQQMKLDKR